MDSEAIFSAIKPMLNPIVNLAVHYGITLSSQLSAKGQGFAPLDPRLNTAVFSRDNFT
jgi:hypothetical protein